MTLDSDELLLVARETIDKVRFCFAVTTSDNGETNARVVEPGKLEKDWRVRFITNRKSRKVGEVERSGRLLLAYQYDPEAAYVTLDGPASIIDDVERKRSVWTEDADKWFPGGPEDSDVVLIELFTTHIELWSEARSIMPGIGAAVLDRDGDGWACDTT